MSAEKGKFCVGFRFLDGCKKTEINLFIQNASSTRLGDISHSITFPKILFHPSDTNTSKGAKTTSTHLKHFCSLFSGAKLQQGRAGGGGSCIAQRKHSRSHPAARVRFLAFPFFLRNLIWLNFIRCLLHIERAVKA